MDRKRQALIDEIQDVTREIRSIGSFQGDRTYQQEVIKYLDMTVIVLNEDFGKIMDLEAIADQSYDAMEAYLLANEIANEKMDSAYSIYERAHADFAEKHGITLVEGEQSRRDRKIEKAGKALHYYNRLFLIYFKASVQEMHALEAINNNDLMSLEQNIEALKASAEEGLELLDTVSPYNRNDAILINATRRALRFFITEAERDLPKVVDFYITKDNFEKLQSNIQSKDQDDLTREEIDEFNSAVEEYNELIPAFNETLERSHEARENMHEEWEEKVEEFFDRHA